MAEGQPAWEQGLSLLQQGRSQEAVDLLWRAATQDPGSFEARLYLGLALGQLQRHEEAARELRAALTINPQSVLAQYNLGVVSQGAGRHQEALAAYEAALQLDPSYENARRAAEGLRAALGPAVAAPPSAPGIPPAYPAPPPAERPRDTGGRNVVLIIVGVIAAVLLFIALILAAILFPVFAKAREKARQASCLSNLKQLGMAQIMYASDYDQYFPVSQTWCDATNPYLRNWAIHVCPCAPGVQWGYAMNSDMSRAYLRDLTNPAQNVLMYDSTAGTKNAADALTSLPKPGRHFGGNNFAFVDGHCKWFSDSASPAPKAAPSPITKPKEGSQP